MVQRRHVVMCDVCYVLLRFPPKAAGLPLVFGFFTPPVTLRELARCCLSGWLRQPLHVVFTGHRGSQAIGALIAAESGTQHVPTTHKMLYGAEPTG
jgi:hypothetical protein